MRWPPITTLPAREYLKAGARARVVPVPDKSHRALNMGLGEAGDFATGEVDRFLADAG